MESEKSSGAARQALYRGPGHIYHAPPSHAFDTPHRRPRQKRMLRQIQPKLDLEVLQMLMILPPVPRGSAQRAHRLYRALGLGVQRRRRRGQHARVVVLREQTAQQALDGERGARQQRVVWVYRVDEHAGIHERDEHVEVLDDLGLRGGWQGRGGGGRLLLAQQREAQDARGGEPEVDDFPLERGARVGEGVFQEDRLDDEREHARREGDELRRGGVLRGLELQVQQEVHVEVVEERADEEVPVLGGALARF